VLQEAMRILKREGQFYLLEQLNLPTDRLHPHSLKLEMFDKWVAENYLKIIKRTKEDDCCFDHPIMS
jgi:ubiquinone/menaquinone biosynthesis C-methylase UbiE